MASHASRPTLNREYQPGQIEPFCQEYWEAEGVYRSEVAPGRPKRYVLDMFPYPSGAGLHVGHPLGYIASDIVARFYRHQGANILHPMGYDAFGLPAEQYAIQTGQHPAKTTADNIARYEAQLRRIGLGYDWSRVVSTADPGYYRWTQWIFLRLFDHYYDLRQSKARPITDLIEHLNRQGTEGLHAHNSADAPELTAEAWAALDAAGQEDVLQRYRLAYLADAYVNWCPALGTVLANDEIKDGFSERGGHPVERRQMRQWMLRITAYANRLLEGLDDLAWAESLKEQQRNWIGRSVGARVTFKVEGAGEGAKEVTIEVFTTRPDTIYGVTFLALAPEHPLVPQLTTPAQAVQVQGYVAQTATRSERDRQAEALTATGVDTGARARHPLSGELVPVFIADYVLAEYGTGAVMGVPGSDLRDYRFAQRLGLPITPVYKGERADISQPGFDPRDGRLINSGPLDGLEITAGTALSIELLEQAGAGQGEIAYRFRDAVFSRQRYWGEPVPIYFEGRIPRALPDDALPLTLPAIDAYLPTADGQPPLARAQDWSWQGHPLETTTMPGWAGSSWYYLRYCDPTNTEALADPEALSYWGPVDLYVGGAEHATGHLLYARFWSHFLNDLRLNPNREPFKRLVNQGMIQGRSALVYRRAGSQTFVSWQKALEEGTDALTQMHVDVAIVEGDELDQIAFRAWRPDLAEAELLTEADGRFLVGHQVEKMSKRLYNVVNPDAVIERYGADTLRLYEMFLGPIELSKPWDTRGIEGVAKFLRRFYRLFVDEVTGEWRLTDDAPSQAARRTLARTLDKLAGDYERLSFNTAVSQLMIAVSELADDGCRSRDVLLPLLVAQSPMAPHLSEAIWQAAGQEGSIVRTPWPTFDPADLAQTEITLPVSINGKTRHKLAVAPGLPADQLEALVLADPVVQRHLSGATPRKVIIVPDRMVNLVL